MIVHLGCVVEGYGEERAVPILVRRIAERIDPALVVQVPRPVLIKRSQLAAQYGELEKRVQMAATALRGQGAVLVLVDSEGKCAARLGPDVLGRAVQVCGHIPIGVVLAHHEYEAWFLAAAESIRGQRGLADSLQPPPDPESITSAKGWLRRQMPANRKYSEPLDQPALTALFDLDQARGRSASFDKCYREIERLLRLLQPPPPSAAEPVPGPTA